MLDITDQKLKKEKQSRHLLVRSISLCINRLKHMQLERHVQLYSLLFVAAAVGRVKHIEVYHVS